MTSAHKINNVSYWQVQALHASIVSSLATLAVLICEKFSFYERMHYLWVQIFFFTFLLTVLPSSESFMYLWTLSWLMSGWISLPCYQSATAKAAPILAFCMVPQQSCFFTEFPLSCLLAFLFIHASFLSSLTAFSRSLPFSLFLSSVSCLKFSKVFPLFWNISLPSAIHFVLSLS